MKFPCKSMVIFSLLLGFAFSALTPPALQAQQKRRVVVAAFNLANGAKVQANSVGMQGDPGSDLSDQLVNKLAGDGKFTVLERGALDKYITAEILRSNSDGFDPTTAAKLGKQVGADSIIIGTVTQLNIADVPTSRGGAISVLTGGNVEERQVTISVSVTARVIDTNTAVVLCSATGSGQSTQKSTKMKDTKSGKTVLDTKGTQAGNGPMSIAVGQAINMMASQLEEAPAMNKPPPVRQIRLAYSSIVADVSGETLILTTGTKNGVQVGDVVEISRKSRDIYSPDDPKKVLKTVYEQVGTATITEADESTATATFSGAGKPKLKDLASYKPKTEN